MVTLKSDHWIALNRFKVKVFGVLQEALRIGDIRKQVSCCVTAKRDIEIAASDFTPPVLQTVTADWSREDYLGQIRCRISSFRNSYIVTPGLYAVGKPDKDSDVFVSANYKLSFDILRRSLKEVNAWLLVLDTKGINVWCAAGKGTFGTDELIRRISEVNLGKVANHRRIILPQLGAPGIRAHLISKKTGFRVYYGPVDAREIPAYIASGYNASHEMRTVRFSWKDRVVLTPMEIIPAMKRFPLYAFLVLLVFGIQPPGILFRDALVGGWPFLFLGLVSVMAGAFVTPLFLPFIPFRAFAIKGWIIGMVSVFLSLTLTGILDHTSHSLLIFAYLFYPLLSSYIALQFTGSTAFTGMSGVKKELKFAIPVYATAAALSVLLLALYKIGQWGLL